MKIKIGSKGFPSTHYGYCEAGEEKEVSDGFAKFCVERMRAADYVESDNALRTAKRGVKRGSTAKAG